MMDPVADKVQALEISLPLLPVKDQVFAVSLIAKYRKYGKLSTRPGGQMEWVEKLLARAMGEEKKPEAVKVEVGSFSAVYALFAKAKEALKWPKISLSAGTYPVQLSLAGPKSKVPGVINVTDGGDYGNNKFYGRVDKEGLWTKGFKPYPESDMVETLLKRLSDDPAGTAQEYGKLTGRCCFCERKLSDERSTAAGFGPVCAQKFGLFEQWKSKVGLLSLTPDQVSEEGTPSLFK